MMTKSRLIRVAMITTALPLVFAVNAVALEKPSLQIAQQAQDQKQVDKKQDRSQRPAAKQRRQERRENAKDQRQERRENVQEKRQERQKDAQDKRQDKRQERREDVKEKRQDRRENVQEKRQDRRENVQDKRQERRENVQEKRQERRENVQDRRQDNRKDAQRARRLEDLRDKRQESREGNRVVIREPGRTIIRENGRTIIRHNEVERFRRFGGRDARVERRGKETFTIIQRPGYRIVTVTGPEGRLIRRVRRYPNGREVVIINNRPRSDAPGFFVKIAPPVIKIPRNRYIVEAGEAPAALLYDTLAAPPVDRVERAYALDEIRYTENLRERMRRVDLDTVTFETGSWEVTPQEAARLEPIAQVMQRAIKRNPEEVFLIEGHTDAIGDEVDNLSLSDRRAEAVALALTERYGVPPENLTTQGYGEQHLKVSTEEAERRNRRVTVRRITPLLRGKEAANNPPSGG